MASKPKPNRDPNTGQFYAVRKNRVESKMVPSLIGAVIGYLAILAFLYGLLSFNSPEVIQAAFENKLALISMLAGVGVGMVALVTIIAALGGATFERVASSDSAELLSSMSKFSGWLFRLVTGIEISSVEQESKNRKDEGPVDAFSYGAVSDKDSFEAFASNILRSLSAYASSSEVTATKLLDKGVAFMAGGLIFYVIAIVIWQIFANLTKPDAHVMYVGMAACSMTFIVVEFLAAWFFKQYRYYVEVSLSCLRVRSVYDRYLLGYYALKEFDGVEAEGSRSKILEVLKEDVKWPTYKGSAANDFNYMIESMGAVHTSMDKLKDVFQSNAKSKPKSKTKAKAEQQ